MPDNVNINPTDLEDTDEDVYTADDFGFIISPDGELKSVMLPENYVDELPIEVQMILKIFNITDFNQLEDKTLH